MKQNKTPTNNICAEKIFNSFVWFKDEKIYLSDKVPTIVAIFLLLIMPPEIKIVYCMDETTCSCDGKLHKHEIKEWKMNKIFPVFKQRYKCSNCGKTITTPLNGLVDKYCNYTSKIMDLALTIDSIQHISYKKKAKLFNKELGLKINRSTVYLHKKKRYLNYSQEKRKGIQKLLKEKNIELSGVYNYDEEFIGNKNQKYARLTLLDANTQVIINDQKIPKEQFNSDFIEIFLTYSLKDLSIYSDPTRPNPRHPLLLPDLKKDIIVTDGDKNLSNHIRKIRSRTTFMCFPQNHEPKNIHLERTTHNKPKTKQLRKQKRKKQKNNKKTKIQRK